MRIAALVVAVLVGSLATARADRAIRLAQVTGKVDRTAIEAALDVAFRGMSPCFRKGGATLKVALEVGADGEVTRAAAAGKGGVGQCVAGLLAVAAFPAGTAWKATIEVDAVNPEQWLTAKLGEHHGELSACQDKDPASKGDVALQLAIAKTGAITAVTVAAATASKPIADCARAVAMKIQLEPLPSGIDVKYRMVVAYGGGGSGAGSGSGSTGGTTASAGSSGGALGGAVIQEHWVAQRGKVFACGAKLAKGGELAVSFRVRADGTVKNVVIKTSTINNPTVEDCVDKGLRGLKFPTAAGETQVSLPIAWAKK